MKERDNRASQLVGLQSQLAEIEESDTSRGYDFDKFKEKYLIRLKIAEIDEEPKKGVIKNEILRIAGLEKEDPKGWDKKLSDQRIFLAVEKGELENSDHIRSDVKSSIIINKAFRIEADRLDELAKGFKTNHVSFRKNGELIYFDNAGEIKKVSESYRQKGLIALKYSNLGGVTTAFRQRNKLPI